MICMFLSPSLNLGTGIILTVLGITVRHIVLVLGSVVLFEALVLFLMKWGTKKRCLWDAFWVNMATTILGLFLPFWIARRLIDSIIAPFTYTKTDPLGLTIWLMTWSISGLIKGG